MKAIRKWAVDTLVFTAAATVSAIWIAGFFLAVVAELVKNAWN